MAKDPGYIFLKRVMSSFEYLIEVFIRPLAIIWYGRVPIATSVNRHGNKNRGKLLLFGKSGQCDGLDWQLKLNVQGFLAETWFGIQISLSLVNLDINYIDVVRKKLP